MSVKMFFQGAVRSLLGESGSRVLEAYMKRVLGADPYDILYDDPKAFYDGLRSFLGPGANALLKILAKNIIKEYRLEDISPDQILDLMEGGGESWERFISLMAGAVGGSG